MGKISGPLLDRIDIHIELPSIKYKDISDTKEAEPSKEIKARVENARSIQKERFSSECACLPAGQESASGGKANSIFCNAQMHTKQIKRYCVLQDEAKELLKMAMTELGLSARAYDKILRVSRTIADLACLETISAEHMSEAIQYRSLDRQPV